MSGAGHSGKVHAATLVVRDEEFMRYLLQGLTVKECAIHLGYSYVTMCKQARRPEFLVKLKELSGEIYERIDDELSTTKTEIMQRLEQASEAALEEMIKLATDAKDSKIRFMASQDLMDRDSRVSRQKKMDVEGHHHHEFIDPLTLIHVAKVAREMDSHEQRQLPGEEPSNPSQQ